VTQDAQPLSSAASASSSSSAASTSFPSSTAAQGADSAASTSASAATPLMPGGEGVPSYSALSGADADAAAAAAAAANSEPAQKPPAPIVPNVDGIQLIAIGLGTPGFAKKFAAKYNFAGPIFVDPTKTLFDTLGMHRGAHFSCGSCVWGTLRALYLGTTRCWCQCGAGDVVQNGGVLVYDAKQTIVYAHKSQQPTDHADPREVITAARKAMTA